MSSTASPRAGVSTPVILRKSTTGGWKSKRTSGSHSRRRSSGRLVSRRMSSEEVTESRAERKLKAGFYQRIKALGTSSDSVEYLQQRHAIILQILTHLSLDTSVFDSKLADGEYLTDAVLLATPTFWFKVHRWKERDIFFLFDSVGVLRRDLDEEVKIVYNRGGKHRRRRAAASRKPKKGGHIRRHSKMQLTSLRDMVRAGHSKKASATLSASHRLGVARAARQLYHKLVRTRGGGGKCVAINEAQWNIQLNDMAIVVDPDVSGALFFTLIDAKERADEERSISEAEYLAKMEAQRTKAQKEEVLSEEEARDVRLAEEKARRKKCKKTMIGELNFLEALRAIRAVFSKKPLLRSAKAKDILALDWATRNLVLLHKVIEALTSDSPVNINESFLTDKLTAEELNSSKFVLRELSSRKSDWRQRFDILTYVEKHLDKEHLYSELLSEESFPCFILGWTAQMLDDRSQLSGTAVQLFPSVVSTAIVRMESAAAFFDEGGSFLEEIFICLFTVLRGRRAVDLCKMAEISAIRVLDILANVCEVEDDIPPNLQRIRSKSITLAEPLVDKRVDSRRTQTPTGSSCLSPLEGAGAGDGFPSIPSVADEKKECSAPTTVSLKAASASASKLMRAKPKPRSTASLSLAAMSATKSLPSSKRRREHSRKRSLSGALVREHLSELVSQDAYLELLEIVAKHSVYAHEKHEAVRAACVTLLGYLIYGIDIAAEARGEQSPRKKKKKIKKKKKVKMKKKKKKVILGSLMKSGKAEASDEDVEEKKSESTTSGGGKDESSSELAKLFMNKMPSRGFLLELDVFTSQMVAMIDACVNDKSEVVRSSTLSLLEKIEKYTKAKAFDEMFLLGTVTRYRKHIARKSRKKGKGKLRRRAGTIAQMRAAAGLKMKKKAEARKETVS